MILMIEIVQMSSVLTKSMGVKKELEMKKVEILTGNVPKFLLIVFFVIPGVSLFSLDLAGTSWSVEPNGSGPHIDFGTDQHFVIGNQERMAEGMYSQTGNDITLNYTLTPDVYREDIKKVGNKLSIVELNDDLLCSYKVVGSGGKEFFSKNHRPPQGAKRKIDGIVVYVYNAGGEVNENARMRVGPGVQYNNVVFDRKQVILPKASGVTIYGRSENQTTIDGITAYWYYCDYMAGYWEYAHGWIWGGLIDFKK
jgi:hypothetical protein